MSIYNGILKMLTTGFQFLWDAMMALGYSISTLNSDKIGAIWDEMTIKLGYSKDKIWM